jgi:GNAT superfamily N-acetyltransferase
MDSMILVRHVTADDWELMREVRLAALSEAPYAFGSTYAREVAFTEETWRGRINERSVTFFAHTDSTDPVPADTVPAGLAGVYVEDGNPDLVSMWVRPCARGRGVAEVLVEAAASWAKTQDFGSLFLWVTESNAPARRLYDRCGFIPTGERQPLPSDPVLQEIRMSRTLLSGRTANRDCRRTRRGRREGGRAGRG